MYAPPLPFEDPDIGSWILGSVIHAFFHLDESNSSTLALIREYRHIIWYSAFEFRPLHELQLNVRLLWEMFSRYKGVK